MGRRVRFFDGFFWAGFLGGGRGLWLGCEIVVIVFLESSFFSENVDN